MKPNPVHRLPAALESAVQRLKLAARSATERTIESLGLAALAANNAFQRDGLLGAQFELNRKSAIFVLAFNDALDARVTRDIAPAASSATGDGDATDWGSLRLVEDRELELEVAAERFGMDIAHACEWELRELSGYLVSLLGDGDPAQPLRNPLRPEVVGHAMLRAIDTVSDRADVRKVLSTELGRSLGTLLRGTYADVVADLRNAGVQPVGLTVRTTEGRAAAAASAPAEAPSPAADAPDSRSGARRSGATFAPSTRSGVSGPGAVLGSIDPALMSVIRRLAYVDGGDIAADAGDSGRSALPNLIHAHRDELRQAATGSLDHMVIDVIGSLFDQILSDPKVPPQMARQIARLQLPVLRAALGDPTFFASRRHPVRRFVNRIASLGAAFDDADDAAAQEVLAKVRELVQDVVQGDFDQIAVYEQKLDALEAGVADIGRREADAHGGAAALLAAKEDEQRLHALYAEQLQGELKTLAAPGFVRDFIGHVWSQVLLAAGRAGDAERLRRLRQVGRDLFMSVQAKTSPQQRKTFLAELPKLMKDLGEGMDLVAWPEAERRAFFGQLLPAHADALKAKELRALDFNLLARQVDTALDKPLPSPADLPPQRSAAADAAPPLLSADEARRVGLVDEAAVDWNAPLDIDLSAEEPTPRDAELRIDGLPPTTGTPEPRAGSSLADHVQVGFAYRMHVDGGWQKARLVHASPGRSFFVFTHGQRHKLTVSLTRRMLQRMCDTGRLRAFENADLLERAQARARRQLASVGGGAGVRG